MLFNRETYSVCAFRSFLRLVFLAFFASRCQCRDRLSRLSYATPVPPGKATWFYTVRVQIGNGYIDCGGSAIASDVVLTAAHCVYLSTPPDGVFLVDPRTGRELDGVHGVAVAVPDAWKDPMRIDFTGDLAIIRFNKEIGASVDTVDIVQEGWSSKSVTIFGRGLTEDGTNSKDLEYIVVPVLSDKEAGRLLEQSVLESEDDEIAKVRKKLPREEDAGALEADHFGAGDLKRDSCQGDSGGPALKRFDSKSGRRDVVAGVVSYGPSYFDCGERGSFGLYTVRLIQAVDAFQDPLTLCSSLCQDVGAHEKWLLKALDDDTRWDKLSSGRIFSQKERVN